MTGTALRVDGTRGYAQGEIFLLGHVGDHLQARVYNTTGFPPCPAEEFDAIDVQELAKETGSELAWKNPRRFWMMDALTVDRGRGARRPGRREIQLPRQHEDARNVRPAAGSIGDGLSPDADPPAQPIRVPGRPVFLLRSPDEITWVMQTFTDHVDHGLTRALLPGWPGQARCPAGGRTEPDTGPGPDHHHRRGWRTSSPTTWQTCIRGASTGWPTSIPGSQDPDVQFNVAYISAAAL
jgi:hypothetical protein